MKYRPKLCPQCHHNRNDAYCADAAYKNEIFIGESQRHCYAFLPKKQVVAKALRN